MNFLVVGLIKSSQIQRLKEEAEKLGHRVEGCHTHDLVIKSDGQVFEPTVGGKLLTDFDLIYLCAGVETKKHFEWFLAADYLKNRTQTKIVNEIVVNPGQKYYPAQSWFYLKQFENSLPQPKTYTVFNGKNLLQITADLGLPLIVKLSETHKGKGVFLANSVKEISEIIKQNPNQVYLLRQFIPNDGDIRVFTIGFKAIGAMRRIPARGEFRSNISLGGTGELFDLAKNPEIKNLAEKAVKVCGVEIAGVDIILDKNTQKPFILEVNLGPQFEGLEKYTGVNAAYEIIKYFIKKS
jgi:ribosomal protein S6--L-glutamate ligase